MPKPNTGLPSPLVFGRDKKGEDKYKDKDPARGANDPYKDKDKDKPKPKPKPKPKSEDKPKGESKSKPKPASEPVAAPVTVGDYRIHHGNGGYTYAVRGPRENAEVFILGGPTHPSPMQITRGMTGATGTAGEAYEAILAEVFDGIDAPESSVPVPAGTSTPGELVPGAEDDPSKAIDADLAKADAAKVFAEEGEPFIQEPIDFAQLHRDAMTDAESMEDMDDGTVRPLSAADIAAGDARKLERATAQKMHDAMREGHLHSPEIYLDEHAGPEVQAHMAADPKARARMLNLADKTRTVGPNPLLKGEPSMAENLRGVTSSSVDSLKAKLATLLEESRWEHADPVSPSDLVHTMAELAATLTGDADLAASLREQRRKDALENE